MQVVICLLANVWPCRAAAGYKQRFKAWGMGVKQRAPSTQRLAVCGCAPLPVSLHIHYAPAQLTCCLKVFLSVQCVRPSLSPLPSPQANTLHTQIGEISERRAVADKSRAGDRSFMQLRQAQQMASMVGLA